MLTQIKKYLVLFILIFTPFSTSLADTEVRTPLSYLTAMVEAHKKSSYELLYILQRNYQVESFRLRHTFVRDKEYAQLLNLDHSREEIILKDKVVSYLGMNFRPFSLNSSHILDNLPNVIYTDYHALQGYAFVDLGRDRVSDRISRVIRLVPNDNFRYGYTLWIDEEKHLLLKSQLHGVNNSLVEEFRVLHLYQAKELEMIAVAIDSLMLPALTATKTDEGKVTYTWSANWLPIGFQLVEDQVVNGKQYSLEDENIDSRLYSNGLSMFSVYVMPSQGVSFGEYAWQQGKLTILNQTVDDKDIVIIGEIPIESAQRILKNMKFSEEQEP